LIFKRTSNTTSPHIPSFTPYKSFALYGARLRRGGRGGAEKNINKTNNFK